jgi:hypothetical protein
VEGMDGAVLGFVGDVHRSNIGVFKTKDVDFITSPFQSATHITCVKAV